MAKILTLDVTSFKFADNETDLNFRKLQNGVIISDSTLSATIKIKQADIGYLKSVSAKWVDKHIVISSGDLSDLPIGSYLLELWLSSSSGYEIYPDSGFVKLSINQNATGISGNLISSITLGEFQQQFSDLAKGVNNKIDDFTKLIPTLENMQQVMRGELNDLHAQTDSNTSNIELNASELSDIRTGDDGYLYATASEAVRHTGTIIENSFKVPITLTAGHYIVSASGAYAAHTNQAFKATDFIDVTGASIIKLDTAFSPDADGYAFYDADKKFVSGSGTYSKSIFVPETASYFRFTAYNIPDNTVRMFLVYPLTKLIPTIDKINKQDVNGKFNKLNNLPYTLTPNQYISYNSGKTANIVNTKFLASSYVNVSSIDVLSIKTNFSGNLDGYAFYDANKVYISGSNVYTTTINVPANAVYFRFTVYNIDINLVNLTGINSLNFIKEQILTINKQVQQPINYYYGIGKTLMIGDSLTSGAYYDDVVFKGASINQNIPYYLGKITNNEVKNAGISGSTPISWHSTEFTKYDYTQFDTFFIWFGTNQGLTDTIENDVNAHASYNDYATTNTGTYCKLIEEIKAVNPDASIHLSTVFASSVSGTLATTNSVINQIATKYDLNIIDMSDLLPANYPNLHLGINNVHFGKSGNIYVANRIANDLNSYFASNQLKLEFGLTPRTD